MIYKFLTLLFLIGSFSLSAQNDFANKILSEANKHAETIIQNEFDLQLAFEHPNIVSMAGGKEIYTKLLKEQSHAYVDEKIKYLRAEFTSPEDVVNAGEELHCLFNRTLYMDYRGAKAEETTILLATSLDGGNSWCFVDLSRHDKESIKLFFPDFNDKLLSAFN